VCVRVCVYRAFSSQATTYERWRVSSKPNPVSPLARSLVLAWARLITLRVPADYPRPRTALFRSTTTSHQSSPRRTRKHLTFIPPNASQAFRVSEYELIAPRGAIFPPHRPSKKFLIGTHVRHNRAFNCLWKSGTEATAGAQPLQFFDVTLVFSANGKPMCVPKPSAKPAWVWQTWTAASKSRIGWF